MSPAQWKDACRMSQFGVTASREGPTVKQIVTLSNIMGGIAAIAPLFYEGGTTEPVKSVLHHGDCQGGDAPIPEIGKAVEVMITRALYRKDPSDSYRQDSVLALLLRPVTEDYALISHDGFECFGTMCRTTASSWMTRAEMLEVGMKPEKFFLNKLERRGMVANITPGRTGVWEADNVNSSYYNLPDIPLRPGKVWVKRNDLKVGRSFVRAEGLARVEDGIYAGYVRK